MPDIESLNENNVAAVAELERECFGSDGWSENLLRAEIGDDGKRYIVLVEDGRVVAYGGFVRVLDEGHIMNIAVAREHRRKGYGSMILNGFFQQAELLGIRSFTLEVRESNLSARRLYEKAGFISEGLRTKYYSDGENCCIYWKYLQEGVF